MILSLNLMDRFRKAEELSYFSNLNLISRIKVSISRHEI